MTQPSRRVVCPRCGGGSAIDAEYASLPAWACPFCASVNPVGTPPAARTHAPADRSTRIAVAAAIVLGVTIALSLALQASHPQPSPRTVAGIVDAMRVAGLQCRDVRMLAVQPPVREEASCSMGGGPVRIRTFSDERRRDATLGRIPHGHHAAGATWIVTAPNAATAAAIARALDGIALRQE